MIISCPRCEKKFEIDENLIPKEGRSLQCGSCEHIWFFKKDKITSQEPVKLEKTLDDEIKIENVIYKDEDKEKTSKNIDVNKTKKIQPSIKILPLLIILIISFFAFILILDTFKEPLSKIIPDLEIYLYSLYEVFLDIRLFITDLLGNYDR